MTQKANALVTQVDERIQILANLTDAAARSESMIGFMQALTKFYKYSLNNILLILIQNPDATRVAGYNDWKKKFNRQVQQGEQGIKILAPCAYKMDPDDEESPMEIKGFRVVNVFDISQTEGEDLPDAPNWVSPEKNKELEAKLLTFAADNDITVEVTEDLPDGTQGRSQGGLIQLAPNAGTKTLIHEIAHELLHKKKRSSRDVMELEAESIAFVVGYTFGLDNLASPNYLALWEADAEKIMDRVNLIRKTAIQIIEGIS